LPPDLFSFLFSCYEDFSRSPHLNSGLHSTGNIFFLLLRLLLGPSFQPFLFLKAESGLSPDSSSIGSRVRSSKVKDAVAPSVSMDSSDSSLDLTAYVEDPKAIVARNVSPPPSVIGVEEVADWRMKYNLPADVIIRVSGPEDRVSDFGVDEVPVYKGYFDSGSGIESLLWWPRYWKPWRFPQVN